MKKILLISLLSLICLAGFPQRFEVQTSDPAVPFKRHFSYSIEKGYVEGRPRQVVAGNQTDWLVNNKVVMGNAINANVFSTGKAVEVINDGENILLTDFTVAPENENSEYAAGTGIYFPVGPTGMGYVYLGIYERRTRQITTLVYYDLLYPGEKPRNTAGTRIKYSANEKAYYISGIMVDRTFVSMDLNNPDCRSKGFILKVVAPFNQASVVVFDPDQLEDPKLPLLCSVNDIQINSSQNLIAFTGVNTKKEFTGHHPMVGLIDMNLNLQWCFVYELTDFRYSGIDVEFGSNDQSVFALFNSEDRPFAITQLDMSGSVMQQPVEYSFDMPACFSQAEYRIPAIARAHIMHLTETNGLIVTGNTYIENDQREYYQSLFRYDIPNSDDLPNGSLEVGPYSCDKVPLGGQRMLTSWWAPENSVYMDRNLFIVGSYNNNDINNPEYGYNFIDVNGYNIYDSHCYLPGRVTINPYYMHQVEEPAYMTETSAHEFGYRLYSWQPEPPHFCALGEDKPAFVSGVNGINSSIWKYIGIDEGGIHAILSAESPCKYQVCVFDITGKKVFSAEYDVDGQKVVYLKFHPGDQLYLITVNNGVTSETLKVPGIR